MNTIESVIDSSSRLGSYYQGQKLEGSVAPSMDDIKGIDKTSYAALTLLKKSFFKDVEDFAPVLITSKGGAFSGCYGPVVRQIDDQLVICAGLKTFPIKVEKEGKKTAIVKGLDGSTVYLEVAQAEFNGYENPALAFTWEINPDNSMVLYCPLGIKLEEGQDSPKAIALNAMLLGNELGKILMDPPKPSLPTFAMKNLPKGQYTLTDLQIWTSKKTGDSVVALTVTPQVNEDGLVTQVMYNPTNPAEEKNPLKCETVPIPQEGIKVYAPSKLINKLLEEPDISPEKPATLIIHGAKEARNGGVSLDCGITYHEDQVFKAAQSAEEDTFDLSLLDL